MEARMGANNRGSIAGSGGPRSRTASAYWLATLLFGLLFVLLILITSWLLRTIVPAAGVVNVRIVDATPLDTVSGLKASLADMQADGERLRARLSVLSDDLQRTAEYCKSAGPSRSSPSLPADRWASKDLSVVQGCWDLGGEAPTVRGSPGDISREEDCTSKAGRICFDASGHGHREQTISCPHAGIISCSAPVVAAFGGDGTFTTTQPDVVCQSGSSTKWNGRTLSCRRIDDDHASCRDGGRPELGLPAQDQEFRRAP